MKKQLEVMLFVMAIAMMMVACESSPKGNYNDKSNSIEPQKTSSKFPIINENGVTPFLLDSSFLNIPPRGDYYDNIKLNRFYLVIVGDRVIDIADNELNDFYNDFGSDAEVLGFYGTGIVMQGLDTLLTVTYGADGIIYEVEVFSKEFHFENGIHVGLTSETMALDYNAIFLTTDYNVGEAWMCYYVEKLPKNIILWASNVYDIFDGGIGGASPSYWGYPTSGEEISNDNCFFKYKMPMDKVKNSHLVSIRILKKDYESFNP